MKKSVGSLLNSTEESDSKKAPEFYWKNRTKNVLGNLTVHDVEDTRQSDTYRVICDLVTKYSSHQVADFGCNVGVLGMMLRKGHFFGKYVGIDFNPHALRIAKENLSQFEGSSEFHEGNLRRLQFPSEFFDVIVLKDVLEHLEDYREVLTEVLRVTQNYAIVANFIPWTEGNSIIRKEPAGFFHNLYSRREVYGLISDMHFEIVSVTSALERDARPNEIILLKRAISKLNTTNLV